MVRVVAQLRGKSTSLRKIRRAAEVLLDRSEGALDHKKAEIKDVCREEVARLKKAEESRKRQRPPDADDDVVVTGSVNAIDAVAARIADAEKDGRVIEIGDDSPKKAAAADDDDATVDVGAKGEPPQPKRSGVVKVGGAPPTSTLVEDAVAYAKQRVVEVKARPAAKTYDLNDDDESEDDDGLGFDAKQDDGGFSPERNKVFVSRGGR